MCQKKSLPADSKSSSGDVRRKASLRLCLRKLLSCRIVHAYIVDNAAEGNQRKKGLRSLAEANLGDMYTENAGKFYKARSRLYRSKSLQVNTRWKAVAALHNALLCTVLESNPKNLCTVLESTIENWGKKNLAKTTPKR